MRRSLWVCMRACVRACVVCLWMCACVGMFLREYFWLGVCLCVECPSVCVNLGVGVSVFVCIRLFVFVSVYLSVSV